MIKSFKKKKPFQRKNKRCSIYGKKGHFSKNYPNEKEKASKLVHSLDLAKDDDIETYYDDRECSNNSTIFSLEYSYSSSSSDSESSEYDEQHFLVPHSWSYPTRPTQSTGKY